MNRMIVITADELKSMLSEILDSRLANSTQAEQSQLISDTLTLNDAIAYLRENGFVTSKAKMYQLTSKGGIPYGKFGNKLVFSRQELLLWANRQVLHINSKTDGVTDVMQNARHKQNKK